MNITLAVTGIDCNFGWPALQDMHAIRRALRMAQTSSTAANAAHAADGSSGVQRSRLSTGVKEDQ